ncbi:hypothetical protein RCC89_17570 [Cytophagaceae bacterium ABcell3]|nr:hypothetical protein RCC89_17570 [Cytophagaceae bacterium ABcell3]
MLEYTKTILKKVSFDKFLFEKELKKATGHVSVEEFEQLMKWCEKQYGHLYPDVFEKYLTVEKSK